jgi:hypothetical protein
MNEVLIAAAIGFYVVFLAYRVGYFRGRKHAEQGWRYYE